MKKISKILFAFAVFFTLKTSVFAESFYCNSLGQEVQIDYQVAHIVKYVILAIQIAVPIILVIMGTIDLAKGVIAQKDDEIAAGRKTFIKRLITGALVFFVFAIVKLVISMTGNQNGTLMSCAKCFIDEPSSSC